MMPNTPIPDWLHFGAQAFASFLSQLTITNWIAVTAAAITTANLLLVTRQIAIQNRISKANLMRDRFETYWRTYQPVSDAQVENVHLYPEDWMSSEKYEEYRNDDKVIKRYIAMSQLFEYLAFAFYGKKLGIKDPLGDHWIRLWTTELAETNKQFLEVMDYYRAYYPEFCNFIESCRDTKAGFTNANQTHTKPSRATP